MKSAMIKLAVAIALMGTFAVGTFTLTSGATAAQGCIPQYDSTGAQIAPYC